MSKQALMDRCPSLYSIFWNYQHKATIEFSFIRVIMLNRVQDLWSVSEKSRTHDQMISFGDLWSNDHFWRPWLPLGKWSGSESNINFITCVLWFFLAFCPAIMQFMGDYPGKQKMKVSTELTDRIFEHALQHVSRQCSDALLWSCAHQCLGLILSVRSTLLLQSSCKLHMKLGVDSFCKDRTCKQKLTLYWHKIFAASCLSYPNLGYLNTSVIQTRKPSRGL